MTVDLYAIAEAAGRCECGVPLAEHPPLPRPKPWSHGRPCGSKLDERQRRGTGAAFSYASAAIARARAS